MMVDAFHSLDPSDLKLMEALIMQNIEKVMGGIPCKIIPFFGLISYRAMQYLQNELLTSILCQIEPYL